MKLFKELPLKQFIQDALLDIHFETLTPVQEEVIPQALDGHSLIVQSQTGSGKTHSFLVPILNQIDADANEVQAVVTAPSRELAEQLYNVAIQIAEFSEKPIKVVRYIGGTDKQRQLEKLQNNEQPQLVIGTPGRIFDLMSENALWVQSTKTFVVDEADMTMDLGFLSIVDEIASRMPEELQIMVFSATIPQTLEVFLNKYMTAPKVIEIDNQGVIADMIENYLIYTRGRDRAEIAYSLLTMGEPYLALIFCNTKQYADEVSHFLKNKGLKVATIHGGLTPRERKRVMRQIRDLEFQYVVATDLAARGIDIPGTSMVINMEIPTELEFFIHRVGRTGRNNIKGVAYTLIEPDNERDIHTLEKKGIEFEHVDIVKGEIREVKARNARAKREDKKKNEDTVIKGMIQRNKKRKVKPGYKKKLDRQIQSHKRTQTRQNKRKK
ncbi:MAG TPA: DEAD/DEAH box helicase [Facklamia tabacinasalis]|uniref:DEAD-box ATP-dependent RNA helicase CshB n=1 Tax=Ruoffia tabacinasalis TaxID=87458 RepID=A0A5R9EG99_9LACT|nr:DEAD/DEAH box helicase [Ruoffia tabacinasalis]TLQ49141.1 DEAD/DEAH box helicase [Ruoffia tabacinasalis]HJG48958.1 DEAD/DEAH box helicase [Ruoffia tabacinasalis]